VFWRGIGRQFGDAAADRRDAHHRFVDATHLGAIAGAGHAVAEQVETHADVADAGGCEGAGDLRKFGATR
jgi:hypothetical protein